VLLLTKKKLVKEKTLNSSPKKFPLREIWGNDVRQEKNKGLKLLSDEVMGVIKWQKTIKENNEAFLRPELCLDFVGHFVAVQLVEILRVAEFETTFTAVRRATISVAE
jgi:hypothetical protein